MARSSKPIQSALQRLALQAQVWTLRTLARLGFQKWALARAVKLQDRHAHSFRVHLLVLRLAVFTNNTSVAESSFESCLLLDSRKLCQQRLPGRYWLAPLLIAAANRSTKEPEEIEGVATDESLGVPPIVGRRARGRRILEVIHVPMAPSGPTGRNDDGISPDELANVDWDRLWDQLGG